MRPFATLLICVVAVLHAWFMILEMALWTRPIGRRTFGLTEEFAIATRALAANQGLYNGFLVAGLVWAAIATWTDASAGFAVAFFFLACVIVAGVFGAATVDRKILFVQALPACMALGAVWLLHAR